MAKKAKQKAKTKKAKASAKTSKKKIKKTSARKSTKRTNAKKSGKARKPIRKVQPIPTPEQLAPSGMPELAPSALEQD